MYEMYRESVKDAIDMPGKCALSTYAKAQYYDLEEVEGGRKAVLSDIIKDRVPKLLMVHNYTGKGRLWVEISLGFDGAGSYVEYGRTIDPNQKNQIFGNKKC